MTVYGAMTVGRVTLTEDWQVSARAGSQGRTLDLTGQEASEAVGGSQATARDRVEGLLSYLDAVVPVTFTNFTHLNGWYRVTDVRVDESTWGTHTDTRWELSLDRLGGDSEIEIESRLIGGTRTHASSATPELWHAPAAGWDGYYVGTATPGNVTRSVEVGGSVAVLRPIPAGVNPRWSVPAVSYLAGAASVTVNGVVRSGRSSDDTPGSWRLSNGIIRVEPRTSTGTLLVSSWLGSAWGTAKAFDVKRGSTSLGAAQHVTVLRNDPCEVVVRLTWSHNPGRTVVDLSLKRGSRFVGVFVQQYEASSALRVDDNGGGGTVSNQLTAAGYIASTTSDANGNRWVLGTAVAATAAGTFGFAANVAALTLPAYIGCVYGGASPAAGDAAADVNAQWLGAQSETERVILR